MSAGLVGSRASFACFFLSLSFPLCRSPSFSIYAVYLYLPIYYLYTVAAHEYTVGKANAAAAGCCCHTVALITEWMWTARRRNNKANPERARMLSGFLRKEGE